MLIFRFLLLLGIAASSTVMAGVNYEEAPIHYSNSEPSNRITDLQQKLKAGAARLAFQEVEGYVPSLLKELDIPISSQVLVFSKTSLQDHCIGPKSPRAIYFNDDTHVGFVQDGMIEIAVTDPLLGKVFYTVDQDSGSPPEFRRKTNNCMNCHGAARTRNVPGLLVRSVHPDPNGKPVVAAGSFVTTHSSPLNQRWGGWYVTGTHGIQQHLGNFQLPDSKKPKGIDNAAGQNQVNLQDRFDARNYLSPHSDIVALMVLEHQADTHNLITIANYETRHALYERSIRVKEDPAGEVEIRRATSVRIDKSAEPLVRNLLFCGETELTSPIEGTSEFTKEFANRAPHDKNGRSLREFDLKHRVFKYPCSYLVYSDAFQTLPIEVRTVIFDRLQLILTTKSLPTEYAHLSDQDRIDIHQILIETLPGFAPIDTGENKSRSTKER
jgi:hypothetical protein